MTHKEAAMILKYPADMKSDDFLEALDMAVDALEKQSRIVELPCPIGTRLFKVTIPYRGKPHITEFVVKNFRTVGKKHKIMLEVQAINVPVVNLMEYSRFCTTREEAEKKLEVMKNGKS